MNLRPPGYEPDELPGCSTPQSDESVVVLPARVKGGGAQLAWVGGPRCVRGANRAG